MRFRSASPRTALATVSRPIAILALALAACACGVPSATAGEIVKKDDQGRLVPIPVDTPEKFRNPLPPEEESAFIDRINHALHQIAKEEIKGNTFQENEKNLYPRALTYVVAGDRAKGLEVLQGQDDAAGGDHKHTAGIDFYWCFTLKGQMRKYFYTGHLLKPEYKKRMYEGGKAWTKTDPKNTPHPIHKKYNHNKQGWGPDRFGNRQVDGRRTDNLWAMSDTSIYLMAEETGNEETRQAALKRIRRYVETLYSIGMGEWDSENYLSHTMSAYINLYDFAKDEEARLLAKAALDYFSAIAAVKYYRGGWCGPTKRDYGNTAVMDGNAMKAFLLYFGDSPLKDPPADRDDVHHATSAYRAPMAVVALARKQIKKPTELWITHPTYENWKTGGDTHPEFHETTYIANSYQLGTLPFGSWGDVNGFNLLTYNSKRGADYFMVCHVDKLKMKRPGRSKQLATNQKAKTGRMNVAQYKNLVLYLTNKGDAPFLWLVPPGNASLAKEGDTYFLKGEKTWIAITPIHLKDLGVNAEETKKVGTLGDVVTAMGDGSALVGFAMEVGEKESHGDFAAFKDKVAKSSKLDLSKLGEGTVGYTGSDGKTLALQHNPKWAPFYIQDEKQPWVTKDYTKPKDYYASYPRIWRDGKLFEWMSHFAQYQNTDGSKAPINLGWKDGTLRVEAGGHVFTGTLKPGETYTFTNETE